MKLSKHGKQRMAERTSVKKNQMPFFRNALLYGKAAGCIKPGKVRDFIASKSRRAKAKLYKGYVFIYSKNGKQLYTMYKLPDYLLEGDEK